MPGNAMYGGRYALVGDGLFSLVGKGIAKLAGRAVPGLGTALLVKDVATIGGKLLGAGATTAPAVIKATAPTVTRVAMTVGAGAGAVGAVRKLGIGAAAAGVGAVAAQQAGMFGGGRRKIRRMNVTNVKALKRATKRLGGFHLLSNQVESELRRLAPKPRSSGRCKPKCR